MGLTADQLASLGAGVKAGAQFGGGIGGFLQGRTNAKILKRRGEQEAAIARRQGVKRVGAQRAAFAKSGVDPNVGTPLDVTTKTAEEAAVDALRLRFAAENEARFATRQGVNALIGGVLGAGSTLLGEFARDKGPKRRVRGQQPRAVLGRLP